MVAGDVVVELGDGNLKKKYDVLNCCGEDVIYLCGSGCVGEATSGSGGGGGCCCRNSMQRRSSC